MDNKKEVRDIIIMSIFVMLLSLQVVNADLFDDFLNIWESITGFAESDTTTASVTVASVTPVIPNGDIKIPATQTITEDGFITITLIFNATDADGAGDLNLSTAQGYINSTTGDTRFNLTCTQFANVNSSTERFECNISLFWFDIDGDWTINVSIKDNSSNYVENIFNTFTVAATKGMKMDEGSLAWTSINLGDSNKLADGNLTINNSANTNLSSVNVTAYNLHGTTTASQFIFADNFSVQVINNCDGPDGLGNASNTTVTNTTLEIGNHTAGTIAQQDLAFCLEAIEPGGGSLSVQTYDTTTSIAWDINVG